MRAWQKGLALIGAIFIAHSLAFADEEYISLSAFPSVALADGRSLTTVTASVRNSGGQAAPDGTLIAFSTTLGSFRESVVPTSGGVARGILISSAAPGQAKITAMALSGSGPPGTLDFSFVASRSDLDGARDYIEVTSPDFLRYATDLHILAASAVGQRAVVEYKDMIVKADDIQLEAMTYQLRARNALVEIGKSKRNYQSLELNLSTGKGFGTTSFPIALADSIGYTGREFEYLSRSGSKGWILAKQGVRFGLVKIDRSQISPVLRPMDESIFQFQDFFNPVSSISAKRAVVFPQKGVQFQQAKVYVANSKVLNLPLFEVNFASVGNGPITEQILNVNDNQLAINYPYYLSLKPGLETLLRFQMGQYYGNGYETGTGAMLNYEVNWNQGDAEQGNFTLSGLGRNDWGAQVSEYRRFDSRSSFNAQIQMPEHSGLFGATSYNRDLGNFQVSLAADASHSLIGPANSTQSENFDLQSSPLQIGKMPLHLMYGLTAIHSELQYSVPLVNGGSLSNDLVQQGFGMRTIVQLAPIRMDKTATITGSFGATQLLGNAGPGQSLSLSGNAILNKRLSNASNMTLTYNFTHDGFNDQFLGEHQIGLETEYAKGLLDFSFDISKSIDVERSSIFSDLSYRLGGPWSFSSMYSYDNFLGYQFLDYNFVLGYKIGWKMLGLVWSDRTRRFGIQLVGASF